MDNWELIVFFFLIAMIYASVGFGGGSSYIAILALYEIPFIELRAIALVCNIIVVTGGTLIFIKNKQVNWKKVLPVILFSVPLAFVGASMKLSEHTFFILLGCGLILTSLALWIQTVIKSREHVKEGNTNFFINGAIAGSIGFFSGMVGIGGGIFLAPVLHFLNWDTAKKIAATASLFILANSIAGLAGQYTSFVHAEINNARIVYLCIAVLLGGQIGSRLSAVRFNTIIIKRVTATLIFVAGVEIITKHLHAV